MINFCFFGSRDCIALKFCANTLRTMCKLQKKKIECHIVLVETKIELQRNDCNVVAQPFVGRMQTAVLTYYGYDIKKSIKKEENLYTKNWNSEYEIPPLQNTVYDEIIFASQEIILEKTNNKFTKLFVNGRIIHFDFLVQSQNNTAFHVKELDKSLRALQICEKNFDIPMAPSQAPLTNRTDKVIVENAFLCGKAALYSTKDAAAVSGIFVAQYIKFMLKVSCDYFTVVTSNAKKAAEYENICGPVYLKNPKTYMFAVNLHHDALNDARKKRSIVSLKVTSKTDEMENSLGQNNIQNYSD